MGWKINLVLHRLKVSTASTKPCSWISLFQLVSSILTCATRFDSLVPLARLQSPEDIPIDVGSSLIWALKNDRKLTCLPRITRKTSYNLLRHCSRDRSWCACSVAPSSAMSWALNNDGKLTCLPRITRKALYDLLCGGRYVEFVLRLGNSGLKFLRLVSVHRSCPCAAFSFAPLPQRSF
jgi:hypothetical protein